MHLGHTHFHYLINLHINAAHYCLQLCFLLKFLCINLNASFSRDIIVLDDSSWNHLKCTLCMTWLLKTLNHYLELLNLNFLVDNLMVTFMCRYAPFVQKKSGQIWFAIWLCSMQVYLKYPFDYNQKCFRAGSSFCKSPSMFLGYTINHVFSLTRSITCSEGEDYGKVGLIFHFPSSEESWGMETCSPFLVDLQFRLQNRIHS